MKRRPEVDVVYMARKLLANPKRWVRGTLARSRNGRHVNPTDPFAVQWCATGAIDREAKLAGQDDEFVENLVNQLDRLARSGNLVSTNDNDGREAVLDVFDDYLLDNNVLPED